MIQPHTDEIDHKENVIEIRRLNKWFGSFHVLRDINLDVKKTERIVICGPSGSGKSTLIRCINHLEEHQEGQIKVDGKIEYREYMYGLCCQFPYA